MKVSEGKIQRLQEANAAKKIQRGWRKHHSDVLHKVYELKFLLKENRF